MGFLGFDSGDCRSQFRACDLRSNGGPITITASAQGKTASAKFTCLSSQPESGNCVYVCGSTRCGELTGYCESSGGRARRQGYDPVHCQIGQPAKSLATDACGAVAIRFNSDDNLTPDKIATIVSDFQYLAAHYFLHPSYLKLGGKPVVFFYSSLALNPVSEIRQMVSSIRTAMSAAGFNVYLIGDEYYALNPPDPARIGNWDAIFGYNVYVYHSGYSDDNGYLALHSTMYSQYQAVAQQLGVDFVPSVSPGFNDRAVRRTCANNPALARRTSATAAEGSMFSSFLGDLALPYAKNTKFKMIHITTFNEWHEDTQIEPSVVAAPTTTDTSPTGTQYTQGLVYQGYGTTYLDVLRSKIAAAQR